MSLKLFKGPGGSRYSVRVKASNGVCPVVDFDYFRRLAFCIAKRQSKCYYRVWKTGLRHTLIFANLFIVQGVFAQGTTIPNPIQANNFPTLILTIVNGIMLIGIPLAIIAIIFAGFKFIASATSGNEAGLKEARKMFLWILIGVAILVGARVIAQAVVNFAQGLS